MSQADQHIEFTLDGPRSSIGADALSALGRSTFIRTFGHLYKSDDLNAFLDENHSCEVYRRVLNDPDYGVWTAHAGDQVGEAFGYLVAGPCNLPIEPMPEGAGELMRFYLQPEWQGRGVGKIMIERALAWMEERFDHLYLSVYAENVGAQRLYQRYGFAKAGDYHFMVGSHRDPEFIFKRR